MLPVEHYYPVSDLLFVKWLITRGWKQNWKIQIFSFKSGRRRLQEVVASKFNLETFGISENWSLGRGSHLQEVVATGGWTVTKRFPDPT